VKMANGTISWDRTLAGEHLKPLKRLRHFSKKEIQSFGNITRGENPPGHCPRKDELMIYQVGLLFTHEDRMLKKEFKNHLAMLVRGKKIEVVDEVTLEDIPALDILVSGVSSSFLGSPVLLEIWEAGIASGIVCIPFILSHCNWKDMPGGKKQPIPLDGKPVISWPDRSEGFSNAAGSIRRITNATGEK
jgi:hypothetical protein